MSAARRRSGPHAGAGADSSYERIYDVVRRVPRGRVVTYGQVAAMAGFPGQARQVGYALHALDEGSDVPWHRVVNAAGKISLGDARGGAGRLQRALLEAEGIAFDARGRIALDTLRWDP
jgi:methylated-DNA-protein-cysteine methyltransferase-like protein